MTFRNLVEVANEESGLLLHAKRELQALGYKLDGVEDGGPNKWIVSNLLELVKVFAAQGHSGMSASYCLDLFSKLAAYQPLGPLTGEDWEWMDVSEMSGIPLKQNIRCSHVFKEGDWAYDINGRIFREPNGSCFTSKDSKVTVTFPYTPVSEYVDVPYSESSTVTNKVYRLPRVVDNVYSSYVDEKQDKRDRLRSRLLPLTRG